MKEKSNESVIGFFIDNRPQNNRVLSMSTSSVQSVRVRFAPSPTGYLHIGGARTALFNFLFARKNGGQFLLRIEDTDLARSSPEMTENILASLRWLGLSWEGEPVRQSARRLQHEAACRDLLHSGLAYPCFCDPEALREKKEKAPQGGTEYRYDRACLRITKEDAEERMRLGASYAVRFRIPEGKTVFRDLVRGEVAFDNAEIDDFILLRSDGSPVYQAAVVADDHDMGITHVIRGDDHLSNTPKQILLYRALGWPVPEFGHVPMILGPDKKRLSKRHGATSVEEYRRQGILPEALRNFLALLGWSPGGDREIMSLDEMIEAFSISGVSKKSAVFDETKLGWMNQQYLQKLSDEALIELVFPFPPEGTADPKTDAGKSLLEGFVRLMRPRVQKLSQFLDQGAYFFSDPGTYDSGAAQKHWADPSSAGILAALADELAVLSEWNAAEIEKSVRGLADRMKLKAGRVIHSARLALTGSEASPGLFELIEVLGRVTVLRRLERALEWMRKEKSDLSNPAL
jgi:glutamyl-tRNA synthetase